MGGLSPSQAKSQNANSVANAGKTNSPNSYGGPQSGDVPPQSKPSAFLSSGNRDRGVSNGPNPSGGNPAAKAQAEKPAPILTPGNAGLVGPPPENKKGQATPHDILDPTAKNPKNSGSGFGAGRVKFVTPQENANPKSPYFGTGAGSTKTDNLITSFAGQQAKETFLANQGLGNNGVIVNQAKFAFADFRPVASYNLSGVAGDKNNPEPSPFVGEARVKFEESNFAYNLLTKGKTEKSNPPERLSSSQLDALGKSGNAGQAKLTSEMLYRGSAKEDQVKQAEADRASKIYGSDFNSDYLTGGKKSQDDNIWHPPVGNVYKNMGQEINGLVLVRGSKAEEKAKTDQASKAVTFYNSKKDENADYITGGKPDNSGGVVTPQSAGKSYGYAWVNSKLGTVQLVRGSEAEKIAAFEAGRPATPAKSFGTAFGTDLLGRKDNSKQVFESIKSSSPEITTKTSSSPSEGQIALANGMISLSNQQIKEKNLQNEKDFNSFVSEGVKQDALFTFYSGGKQVGQTSGARSRYDILSAEKQYGSGLRIEETFPSKERELTNAVQKNPTFYAGLSTPYWDALSKAGYISKNNIGKIQTTLDLEAKTQNRENLALLQGSLFSEIHGGPIPTKTGVKNIGPAESEVASFLKFPFVGQKVSTSTVRSTSLADVAQFYPGIPTIREADAFINALKGGIRIGGAKDVFLNNVRQKVANKVAPEILDYRQIRPTNLKELEPVGTQVAKQTMGKRPETVLETTLRTTPKIKENPNYEPNRNVFNPKPQPNFDINFKTETPVFRNVEKTDNTPSPKEKAVQDRYPLMTNVTNALKVSEPTSVKEPRITPKSSSESFLNNKGPLPFAKPTKPDSNLSPVSREFFGVQFKGTYPTSYLPQASGFATVSKAESLSPEFTNILGRRGNPPIKRNYDQNNPVDKFQTSRAEFVSKRRFSSEEFLTSSGKKGSALSDTFGVLGKTKTESSIQIFPEETNPLGRRGKPPIKSSSIESTQSRSEVVEQTRPRYTNEVFSSSGKALSPGILFGETKPIGALAKTNKVLKTGKIIDLEPRKDYQEWRFTNWQKKNPEPEKIGDSRFQSYVNKLPSRNTKSAVISDLTLKQKETKIPFTRTSKNLFEEKKAEPKKGSEFSNKGSKSETILLQKPLTRKRLVSSTEQQYETGYEFKPVPGSKSETGLISVTKLGSLSGFAIKSGYRQDSKSLLNNLNKTIEISKSRSRLVEKQSPKLFTEQTPKQNSKQFTGIWQTPKQSTTPKQTNVLVPKSPTPSRSKQSVLPKFDELPRFDLKQTTIPPKKVLPTLLLGANKWGNRKSKSKSGPTGLISLNVNNIFASSLSINVAKNKRIEF